MSVISAYSSTGWFDQFSVSRTGASGTGLEDENSTSLTSVTSTASTGDTITISAEALQILADKMKEYGATSLDDLTEEEQEDILGTAAGILEQAREEAAASAEGGSGSDVTIGGRTVASTGEASTTVSMETASEVEEEDDAVASDKLMEMIKELESEIEQLVVKAFGDEGAEKELKEKRTELSALKLELNTLDRQSNIKRRDVKL